MTRNECHKLISLNSIKSSFVANIFTLETNASCMLESKLMRNLPFLLSSTNLLGSYGIALLIPRAGLSLNISIEVLLFASGCISLTFFMSKSNLNFVVYSIQRTSFSVFTWTSLSLPNFLNMDTFPGIIFTFVQSSSATRISAIFYAFSQSLIFR